MNREELLRSARNLYENPGTNEALKVVLEETYPELKESEDERIRKFLIEKCNEGHWPERNAFKKEQVIAYLERQKEQKPVLRLVGDGLISDPNAHFELVGEQKPAESISRLTIQGNGVYKICPHCKERMIRDDSKVYTSMPPQYGYTCPKCGAMEFDTVMYDSPEMKEQQLAEWSKKDMEMKRKILKYLSDSCNVFEYNAIVKWLNNLRPQPHWKPSKEQMKALNEVANNGVLLDLFNDLLKLL